MKTTKQQVIYVANRCHIVDKNLPPTTLGEFKEFFFRVKLLFLIVLFYLARLLLISPGKGQGLGAAQIWHMFNSNRRMLL